MAMKILITVLLACILGGCGKPTPTISVNDIRKGIELCKSWHLKGDVDYHWSLKTGLHPVGVRCVEKYGVTEWR